MKIRGTDFFMFQVTDLARAAGFYRETLGLSQEMYSDQWQWAEFNCGNVVILHHRADGTCGQEPPPGHR